VSDLELNLDTHEYTFAGKPVSGVSEILTGLNLIDAQYFTEYSRERGTAIHAALEIHMGGGLDWTTVDPRIQGYVTAGVNFLNDAGVRIGPGTFIERPIYHPLHQYAGCPDLVCVAFEQDSVIDFKSGGLGLAGVQTALYEMMARIAYPLPKRGINEVPRRRLAIQLFPDGRYKETALNDGFDYSWALSAVSLYKQFVLPRARKAA
jgi:hypothetical protein